MNKRNHVLQAVVLIGLAFIVVLPGSATFLHDTNTTNAQTSLATTTFVIENPPVDFEVIDAEPFDGHGNNGPFSTFNDVLLGALGECRSMAEFDISPFSVPPGEYISMATLEVIITSIEIYGLGVNGETPESLAVDGYLGNGLEELSDFEAGDGNVLDSIELPDPQVGQVLSFDVTAFVTELVNAQEQYVGLTLRAETFGGLWVTEGGPYPKLTIETKPIPTPDLDCEGSLEWDEVKPGATVTGTFSVGNIGDDDSLLTWKVDSWPSWGTWTFTPLSGDDLPKGSWVTVTVTVVAPDEKPSEFSGNVTVLNVDDPSDFCIIPVYLKTPVKHTLALSQFLERLLERFPNAFPILRHLQEY